MLRHGLSYDKAHELACKVEFAHRPNFTQEDAKKLTPAILEMLPEVAGKDHSPKKKNIDPPKIEGNSFTGKISDSLGREQCYSSGGANTKGLTNGKSKEAGIITSENRKGLQDREHIRILHEVNREGSLRRREGTYQEEMGRFAEKESKSLDKHKYGCLMALFPEDFKKELTDWCLENIPEFHLGKGGRELRPHCTVVFGFKDGTEETIQSLRSVLTRNGPFEISLQGLSLFKDNPDGDVLKLSVHSPDLEDLNYNITSSFDVETKHKYNPHITLAYILPEFSHLYEKLEPPFAKREVQINSVEWSGADGNKEIIPLSFLNIFKAMSAYNETTGGAIVSPPTFPTGERMGRDIEFHRNRISPVISTKPHSSQRRVARNFMEDYQSLGSGVSKSLRNKYEKRLTLKDAGAFLARKWAALENRYGRKQALTMAVAMLATIPIPGNIAAVIGIAEGIRGLQGFSGKTNSDKESYFHTCERDNQGHCKTLFVSPFRNNKCMVPPNAGKPGKCPGGTKKPKLTDPTELDVKDENAQLKRALKEKKRRTEGLKVRTKELDRAAGSWITIGGYPCSHGEHCEGTKVQIDSSGKIKAGPKNLVDKKLKELGKKGKEKKVKQPKLAKVEKSPFKKKATIQKDKEQLEKYQQRAKTAKERGMKELNEHYEEEIAKLKEKMGLPKTNKLEEKPENKVEDRLNRIKNERKDEEKLKEHLKQQDPNAEPESNKSLTGTKKDLHSLEVAAIKPLGGGANASQVIDLKDDGQAVFKSMKGEHPKLRNEIKGKYYIREAAASSIADLLGLGDLVPPTIVRKVNGELGSAQQFVPDAEVAQRVSQDKRFGKSNERLARAAAFDFLTNNSDRHRGNWMVNKKGDIFLIDNGLSFPDVKHWGLYSQDHIELIMEARHRKIPIPAEVKEWANKKEEVKQVLKELGLPDKAIELTERRLNILSSAKDWREAMNRVEQEALNENR